MLDTWVDHGASKMRPIFAIGVILVAVGACSHSQSKFPMTHDARTVCLKPDGTEYYVDMGSPCTARDDVLAKECLFDNPIRIVYLRSQEECISRGGRLSVRE